MKAQFLIALMIAGLSLSAAASSKGRLPDHVPLWRGLISGMSKSEVKAQYPTPKSEISAGCPIYVRPVFKESKLASVVLVDISGNPTCFQDELEAIKRKYGEGESKSNGSSFALGTQTRMFVSNDIFWKVGKSKISYIAKGAGGGNNIGYTVKDDGKYW